MGLNTTIVLMNDCLDNIKNDSDIGYKIWYAVSKHHSKIIEIDSGGACGALKIISSNHNSSFVPVLVGGNTGMVVDINISLTSENYKLDLLKSLADKLGYKISKKKKSKQNT